MEKVHFRMIEKIIGKKDQKGKTGAGTQVGGTKCKNDQLKRVTIRHNITEKEMCFLLSRHRSLIT